jgi:hypothetical protein
MFYQHWQQRRRHKTEHYYQVILMLGSPRLSGIALLHILATPIDWLARLQCLAKHLELLQPQKHLPRLQQNLGGQEKGYYGHDRRLRLTREHRLLQARSSACFVLGRHWAKYVLHRRHYGSAYPNVVDLIAA